MTPIKKASSGTQYFNCILQGHSSAKRAVCFSPKKHSLLHDASEAHSPVKISKLTVSKNDDFVIGDRNHISLAKAAFKVDEKFHKDAVVSLNDLYSLAPGQLLNTNCYVTKVHEETTRKVRNGTDIAKQDVIVADATNSVKVILYGENVGSLCQDKSYLLKNLRLNSFKDTVYLNTAQAVKFDFEEIDEVEHVNDIIAATEAEIFGKIVGVSSIILNFHCTNCDKKLVEYEGSVVFCQECGSQMLKSKCRTTIGLSIVICHDSVNVTLFFPNSQAQQLKAIVDFPTDNDNVIAKALLESDDLLQITFDITSKTVNNVNIVNV